jgi:hypothetical protein
MGYHVILFVAASTVPNHIGTLIAMSSDFQLFKKSNSSPGFFAKRPSDTHQRTRKYEQSLPAYSSEQVTINP